MIPCTYARTGPYGCPEGIPGNGNTYARTVDSDVYEFTSRLVSWGRKPETATTYSMVIHMLTEIMERLALETDPRLMTEDDMYRLFSWIERAPSTKDRYLSIMLQYCRYFGNHFKVSLLLNKETPNAKWISDADVERCMQACRSDNERMMIHLGADYGLRRAEIAGLCVEDIDWNALEMTVYGKGHGDRGKKRTVPLLPDDEMLRSMFRKRTTYARTGPLLVQVRKGEAYDPEYLGKIVKEIMKRAGVDGTCHSLRREFITSAYRACGDDGLVKIMHIVGHEKIEETIGYIRRDPNAMRDVMQARRFYISNRNMQ